MAYVDDLKMETEEQINFLNTTVFLMLLNILIPDIRIIGRVAKWLAYLIIDLRDRNEFSVG